MFFTLLLSLSAHRPGATTQVNHGGGERNYCLVRDGHRGTSAKSTICSSLSLTLRASLKITGTGCAIFSPPPIKTPRATGVLSPKEPLGFLPLGLLPRRRKDARV